MELSNYLGLQGTIISYTKLENSLQKQSEAYIGLIKLQNDEQLTITISNPTKQFNLINRAVKIGLRKVGENQKNLIGYELTAHLL